ncbi:MAG TPA: PH domain-containing protein [Streptosporangiaceae bacterium]|nr:PH domain-containing protein [Streptosporangiaceae bacterium]
MRLLPGGDTVPTTVNKYLLPHEEQVITVRKHPAILIGPVAAVLAGLVVAALLSTTVARNSGVAVTVIWAAWGALLLWLVYKALEWSVTYFVVTSQRMLLITGLVTRKVGMMPLIKVTDMSFRRSAAGRMLGYGDFVLESAGLDQALRVVDHLPYPEQLYLEVVGLIFPGKIDDGDD